MIRRRTVLAAPLALAVGCGVTGPVRVAVTWSGWELARFRAVLDVFETESGLSTEVVPLGDDISAVLGSRRGGAVDVVMLPQIGAVRQNGAQLAPLDAFVPIGRFPVAWRDIVTLDGAVRGIPFKIANKSVVWYRKDVFDRFGEKPPERWTDWLALNARLADRGVAPLALGGADGWILSDFFENVLHAGDDQAYRALVENPTGWTRREVVRAFQEVGRMWAPPGTLSGGADGALLTQGDGAVVDHFLPGRAAMVAGADFTYPVIARHAEPGLPAGWLDWFHFPSRDDNHHRAPKVGADIVVVPAPATEGALALARWLAQAKAQRIWAGEGGMLSVHVGVDQSAYPNARVADLAAEVRHAEGALVYDLADQLGAIGDGLRRVLQDFLRVVGGNPSGVDTAAEDAAARMERIAAGVRREH
ncbi:sugar ABC transporter substrate-binding protein [Lentzea sp. NBRC 105346]|uniref:ABC transporter substrate-binding protein n=1 Tax=Lentzea sp. NBRC 105346 TaxID=3032205 RepID=UPI002555B407|nr:ABC transporter substrate-binding protein [Lentzea sp. NBRC 105346]GLZ34069.1 sugar ABC transporter substrate-binding protein [Lentzea sp. NBRC 105346]